MNGSVTSLVYCSPAQMPLSKGMPFGPADRPASHPALPVAPTEKLCPAPSATPVSVHGVAAATGTVVLVAPAGVASGTAAPSAATRAAVVATTGALIVRSPMVTFLSSGHVGHPEPSRRVRRGARHTRSVRARSSSGRKRPPSVSTTTGRVCRRARRRPGRVRPVSSTAHATPGRPLAAHVPARPAGHRRRRRDERLRARAGRRAGPERVELRRVHPGRGRGTAGARRARAGPAGPPRAGRAAPLAGGGLPQWVPEFTRGVRVVVRAAGADGPPDHGPFEGINHNYW